MHKSKHTKKHRFPWTHYHKISFIYFVIFVMIFSLIDYYAMMTFNFLWLLVLSIVLGWGVGYIHIKKRWHDNIDEVADDLL
jgi:L-asparagine transporter-like permease